jgi:hypothetical protein
MEKSPNLEQADPRLRAIVLALLSAEPAARPSADKVRAGLLALESAQEPLAPNTVPLAVPKAAPAAIAFSLPAKLELEPVDRGLRPDLEPAEPPRQPEPESTPPSVTAPPPEVDPSAFAPPPEREVRITLDYSSHAPNHGSASREMIARDSPRTAGPGWLGRLLSVLVVGGMVAGGLWFFVLRDEPDANEAGAARIDTVSIEIRAKRPAAIRIDGVRVGQTPLTIHQPRGSTPIAIDAEIGERTVRRSVAPDRDQTVDFSR